MKDYQNGKIYKITNCIDDEVYVGSTTQSLTRRFNDHISSINYKPRRTLYIHMKKLGKDKFCISLIENYPCTNRTELLCREGQLIREFGTINCQIAGRTDVEYAEDNKERLIEYRKEYYKSNNERIRKNVDEYRCKNKDKINEYDRERYRKNKIEVNRKQTEKIECDICKCIVSRTNISIHKKTKKCLTFNSTN